LLAEGVFGPSALTFIIIAGRKLECDLLVRFPQVIILKLKVDLRYAKAGMP
jgi:hypothetical protein